jgi:DNA (cytosine-5)-methyltransferase 1
MKVLNLYAGIGGNRKLWTDCEVTAVEWDEETAKVYSDYFPDDKMIIGDAHQYLLDHYKEFDFIWSSPPCPSHSDIRRAAVIHGTHKPVYPDMTLYQEIIFLSGHLKRETPWVVENVIPYYEPLIPASRKIKRHLFWANFKITSLYNESDKTPHNMVKPTTKMYEFDVSGTNITNKIKSLRNLVDPQLGLHIFNAAKGIITKPKGNQTTLF